MDLPPASTEATVLDSDVEDGEVDESGGKSGHGEAVVSSAERESVWTRSVFETWATFGYAL